MASFTLKSVLLCAGLVLLLDIPWLWATSAWAGSMLRDIQGSALKLRIPPALVVYLALGIIVQFPRSALEAAVLGSSIYAVYDFTNYATLTKYQPAFAVADSMWGGTLMAVAWTIKNHFKL
jgi:uncharacterized membrane protein